MKNTRADDIALCKTTTRAYGTSYFISTYFFPKLLRERTWVLYAFVRYPDEIVDTQEKNPTTAKEKILAWKNEWTRAYAGATDVHPILRANAVLWKECSIPFEYSDIFLGAMIQDTTKNRYQTYTELEAYMYGSATVVGYMMSYIIGFTDNALIYAKALGEAFQLTNFLRDIKEDLDRGRVYIPQQDWATYNVTETDFQNTSMTSNMKELILHEIEINEHLYSEALKGISLLDKGGRRAVRIALYLYKEIMEQIKQDPTRVWKERVRVSFCKKIYLIIKHF